jgi:hypothetical protein
VGYAARKLACGMQVQALLNNAPLPHALQAPPAVWLQQLKQHIACAACGRLSAVGLVSDTAQHPLLLQFHMHVVSQNSLGM